MGFFLAIGLLILLTAGLVSSIKSSVEDGLRNHALRAGTVVALAATAGGLVVLPQLMGDTKDVGRVRTLRREFEARSSLVQPLRQSAREAPDLATASEDQEAEADALQADLEARGYQAIRADSRDRNRSGGLAAHRRSTEAKSDFTISLNAKAQRRRVAKIVSHSPIAACACAVLCTPMDKSAIRSP